jgi:hypothetical protein
VEAFFRCEIRRGLAITAALIVVSHMVTDNLHALPRGFCPCRLLLAPRSR